MRVAVLTVSDAGARTSRADTSGDAIAQWMSSRGYALAARALVPDETLAITRTLIEWADGGRADLILTTGGTGLTPRDLTPEATRAALDREAPGIAEALRAGALPRFLRAALSRGLAGVRGKTLIINLPGSPGGVADGLQ
ncbi:MAG: MogA/MoaB family molybdenum cofactor biosynthesis protein, partial [Gemmatimonadales bacterium]|nr:MogA/MoaB family molybdenum cofactor biosynthesis protein [Gemmatimonadales bacterium]